MNVKTWIIGLLAAVVVSAHAADFTVSPVRIFMTPRDRAVAVTVTNNGAEEIVMQADVYTWRQGADGRDVLQFSEDLVLSPPILKVAPNSRQVVRLLRMTPPPAGAEQTYRLIVREVPEATSQKKEEMGLQIALAFSLPVFITPTGAKRQLNCELQRAGPDAVLASCENTGQAYAQPRAFELVGPAGEKIASRETGGYILPGVKRSFEIARPTGAIHAGKMNLHVAMDDGTGHSFEVRLPE